MSNRHKDEKADNNVSEQNKDSKKDTRKEVDDEYVLPEPDTNSVPASPVTGQTADESQEKPGQ